MHCFSIVLDTLDQSCPCFGLVLDIGELTPIGPFSQYPKVPSMICLTMVLDTLDQFPHSSLPCFDLFLDIGELTPVGPLAQYPTLSSMLCFTMVLDTLDQFPHSSLPCFNLVLDIGEYFFYSFLFHNLLLIFLRFNILNNTTIF